MKQDGPIEIEVSIKVNSSPNYDGETLSSVRQEVTVAGNISENQADVIAQLAETTNAMRERVALELDAQAALARIQTENQGG